MRILLAFLAVGAVACSSSEDDPPDVDALRSLPYLEWVDSAPADMDKKGVVIHDPTLAWAGWNLFPSLTRRKALLLDMNGVVLHEWQNPDLPDHRWQHVELLENGDLMVILTQVHLARLRWDSSIVWERRGGFHHDVDLDDAGRTWAIARKESPRVESGVRYGFKRDRIVVLSERGEVLREIDLAPILDSVVGDRVRERLRDYLEARSTQPVNEYFEHAHVNALQRLPRDVPGLGREGQLLLCARDLDLVAVVDPATQTVPWHWGPGELDAPHHPTLLADGRLLIFDNGRARGYSRLLELDPRTGAIEWEYRADPPEAFFTAVRGSSQRLPNGNTLVTESDRGRVFEITRAGDVVWEFFNPHVLGTKGGASRTKREGIYRFTRIAPSETIASLLQDSEDTQP